MSSIKIHGWDKKPRTMLRYLKVGDIFLFALDESSYAAGRILSRVAIGHGVEFFDLLLLQPEVTIVQIETAKRMGRPVFIDAYCHFDRKVVGDWRIVGHHHDFVPSEERGVYFTYGDPDYQCWKIDLFGNETEITAGEARELPPYTPQLDARVKRWLIPLLTRKVSFTEDYKCY